MGTAVLPVSNFQFVQGGGLYPGGRCQIAEIEYRLWDAGGKAAANSIVAVYCRMTPLDGSNDGKDVENFWTCGQSNRLTPDHTGGKLLPVAQPPGKAPVAGISDSCHWHQVVEEMLNSCGLDGPQLDGVNGIKALTGTIAQFARVDAKSTGPEVDNVAPAGAPGGQDKKKFKPTVLVPTFVEKWGWAAGAGATRRAPVAAKPVAAAAAAGPVAVPAATAASNGNFDYTHLSNALAAVLEENPDGLAFPDLWKPTAAKMTQAGVPVAYRGQLVKKFTEALIEELAAANGWTYYEGTLLPA